ncbi:MAG: AAA family ATPase, partial [Chlamydiia bacterium]|nr:AAA family ATPase [Chlamydiia bacterium]
MRSTILMVPTGLGVGLTSVTLGLIHAIESQGISAKYLNPFENTDHVERLLSEGKEGQVLEEVITQVEAEGVENGVLIIQGIISTQLRPYAPNLNSALSNALDAEIVFVATPGGKTLEEFKKHILIAAKPYGGIENPRTIGCMINKIGAPIDQYGNARIDLFDPPENPDEESAFLQIFTHKHFKVLGCFPWKRHLMAPRVKDVVKHLNAEIISKGKLESNRVNFFALAGATIENVAAILKPEALIITPSDRSDTMIATCIAYLSGIKIAGLLLTGNYSPSLKALKLCDEAMKKGLPVLKVYTDSLRTAISLQNLNVKIPTDDLERSTELKEFVASHIDTSWVKELISNQTERCLSPPAFRHQLMLKAQKGRKKIILPEGEDPRIIEAAAICAEKRIAQIVLLGDREKI